MPRFLTWLRNLFRHTMKSDGWKFSVVVDGDDLLVENVPATCFGGLNDPQDNGQTASGISTLGTGVMGCALPVVQNHPSTAGSPLPRIPWGTKVAISRGILTIEVPLIDNGPSRSSGNGIDLTIAAARRFDPRATATNFKTIVSYRIPGGAQFLEAQG